VSSAGPSETTAAHVAVAINEVGSTRMIRIGVGCSRLRARFGRQVPIGCGMVDGWMRFHKWLRLCDRKPVARRSKADVQGARAQARGRP